jgi:membrane associated rhomboid family serine protease
LDEPREPIVRAPPVIWVCLFTLAAIHVATLFLSDASYDALIENFALIPARVQAIEWSNAGLNGYTLWALAPFLTYALLHGNFAHLAVNSLAFLAFGTIVARRIGTVPFLALTIVTAIAAALAHLFTNWGDAAPVVGASGAIAGYMGAASRFIFLDPRTVAPGSRPLLPLYSRPVVMFALIWTVANVVFGLTGISPGLQGLTAWQAHLGGYYAGALLFPLFDREYGWL